MRYKVSDAPAGSLRANTIFITGASGSLGRALAMHHASDSAFMHLWGRDAQRLSDTAKAVLEAGAQTQETCLDLNDAALAVERMLEQDAIEPFDLVYLVAGTGETREKDELIDSPELVVRAAQVNFATPAAMAAAIANKMAQRGGGRIVLIGSAAGHHSLPVAPSYSASKAGLARFADALRLAVKPYGVTVTLAAPGFIDTPAARTNSDRLPFMLPVENAAERIANASRNGKGHYVTPWPFVMARAVDSLLPRFVRDRILTRLEQ